MIKLIYTQHLVLICVVLLFSNLVTHAQQFVPKEGDLLFQDLDCGPLCDAIEEVTQGINGAHLSHTGLIVYQHNEPYVLEAISKGVVLTPLKDFLSRSHDSLGNPKVLVGRLKKPYQKLIPLAIKDAEEHYLGKPYDDVYDTSNHKYYCSELLYFIFKDANNGKELFHLYPMTFKQPGSDSIFPQWVDYFKNLGCPVPEGKPGLNPGGISRSDAIHIVHIYGFPEGWKKQ